MQMNFRILPVMILAAVTTFTACKKESTPTDSTKELETHADDQSRVSTQIDLISSEAGFAIESSAALSGRTQNPPFDICDGTITFDLNSSPRKITIVYNGAVCNASYKRTGTVVITMAANTYWKDQGATITATYDNVKVTRISDNKSITINGNHSITNLSGGLLFNLSNLQSITHTVSSTGMSITFDDNSQRTWQVARRRVYTYNNGYVLTITGNHTIGNNTGVAEWGSNRFGKAFVTSVSQPLVIRQDCAFRLTGGEVKHEGFGTATATFGLDASGNPTTCPGTGKYYYKLAWTGPNGGSATAILPY